MNLQKAILLRQGYEGTSFGGQAGQVFALEMTVTPLEGRRRRTEDRRDVSNGVNTH
ncbi:MAG: hypothetical protein WAV28_13230 [Sedimentisphaerales bacterium]